MKSQKTLQALCAVLFAAFLLPGCGGEGAYETFSLAMDKLAGEGQWSDKGHSTSFFGGTLTVSGLTVKNEQGDLEIATVELTKPLEKEELKAIIDAPDWKDRKETAIMEGLTLKDLKRAAKEEPETTLLELKLENVSLGAADANALGGPAGFLKAARIERASYKNHRHASVLGGTRIDMTTAQMAAEGLSFDAQPMAGLENINASEVMKVFSSFSAKNISLKDLDATVLVADRPLTVKYSIGSLDQKGLKGFRASDSLAIANMAMSFEGGEADIDMNFAVEALNLNGFDMTQYLDNIMPSVLAAYSEGDELNDVVNSTQTMADLFVSPISLTDISLKGMDLKIGEIGLKMAEMKGSGPFTAGSMAPRQSTAITGLELILPESAEGLDEDNMKLYQFGQDFGLSRFAVDMASEGSYDAATGKINSKISKFSIRDLADISFGLNAGGLTAERLETLRGLSLDNIFMAIMDPIGTFGEISIENMDITLNNTSLAERIYAYVGKTRLDGVAAESVKDMAAGAVTLGLATKGSEYLANADKLSASVTSFLKDPKTLKVSLNAAPPLSFVSGQAFQGDINALLNSLNLTVAANGETDVQPLSFRIQEDDPGRNKEMEEEPEDTEE